MLPATRWVLGAIVVVAIVALLAWARNDPGVDDRQPDPPSSTVSEAVDPVPVPTTVETGPPTT
jgi:hypothetical protein